MPPFLAATALLGLLLAVPAAAQSPFGIEIDSGAAVTLQLDRLGRRGDQRPRANLFGEIESDVTVTSSLGLGLVGIFKLEQRDRATPVGDQAFREETAYVDQLYLTYTARPLALAVGKIHPRFGLAWDVAPGLYGPEFAERYEIAEQLGGGVDLSLNELFGGWGTNSLRVELFQTDRSFLSGGALNRRYEVTDLDTGRSFFRGRFRRAFGGPGNTADVSSVVVSLAGEGLTLPVGSLDYTLGYSNRRPGVDGTADEQGMVGGLVWSFHPVPELKLSPLVEAVRLDNADGIQDQRRTFFTAGIAAEWRAFTASYTHARQRGSGPGAAQDAVGLDIALDEALPPQRALPGLALHLGWRELTEDQVRSRDLGVALTWAYRF